MWLPFKKSAKRLIRYLYFLHFKTRSRKIEQELAQKAGPDLISPKEVMARRSVERLIANADEYFKNVEDRAALKAKPFANLVDAVDSFYRLGLVLTGLNMGKTMRVLDFGAGSCWLSRILNQLGCSTISVDVSPTALEIGKEVLADMQMRSPYVEEPILLHFNGHRIKLPDRSVDRIICFDAFHHIPNQEEVLAEFYRVLKPSGIVGFSEPGRGHSRTAHSQHEMRSFDVLENNILIEEIHDLAMRLGFKRLYAKPMISPLYSVDYLDLKKIIFEKQVPDELLTTLFETMSNNAVIFFLDKDDYKQDSRIASCLQADIDIGTYNPLVREGKELVVPVRIKNTGSGEWLTSNLHDVGVVRLGAHLFDGDNRLLDMDYYRQGLGRIIAPGEQLEVIARVPMPKNGSYVLEFDLVSELVCWFESVSCNVKRVAVEVE